MHANWCNTSKGHKNRKCAMLYHYSMWRNVDLPWHEAIPSDAKLQPHLRLCCEVLQYYTMSMSRAIMDAWWKKHSSSRHNKNMESCRDMNIQYQSISVVAQWCMLQGHAKTSKHAYAWRKRYEETVGQAMRGHIKYVVLQRKLLQQRGISLNKLLKPREKISTAMHVYIYI